jgi:hypothetical protein
VPREVLGGAPGIPDAVYNVRKMAYAVGQTIEVCLKFDLPPTRGIRRVRGIFQNQRGQVVELSDVPARLSECVVQEPRQIALQGRVAHPGEYKLRRLEVAQLLEVTCVNPPEVSFAEVSFEVEGAAEDVEWRPA